MPQHAAHHPANPQASNADRSSSPATPGAPRRFGDLPSATQQALGALLPELSPPSALPEQITHVHTIPAREAEHAPWPEWMHPRVVEAFESLGIAEPYAHQVAAAEAAHAGLDAALAVSATRYSWRSGHPAAAPDGRPSAGSRTRGGDR